MHGVMRKHWMIYGWAVLCSIFLSSWSAIKLSVINPDAICYLYSAAAMSKGFIVATHLCSQAKWPFYSMLIFGLSQLSHVSYLVSAHLLDGFFSIISVVTFIAIVSTLTLRTRIIALSAVVILLAHTFNTLRAEIVRDHGFWAFYLASLFFLLRYFAVTTSMREQRHLYQWCYAMLWSMSLVIATLFRIEGMVFLILVPLVVFFDQRTSIAMQIGRFLQLNFFMLLGCLALITWVVVHPAQYLGRLPEILFQLSHGTDQIGLAFHSLVQALITHVLNIYSAHDAISIAIVMLLGWYLISVISNVSLIYAGLIIYAWGKKLTQFTPQTKRVIWAYVAINVVITFIFLVDNLFLAKRYLIALSLVLMLWVPFALDDLIRQWSARRWPLLLAVFLIAIYGLGGIFTFGHSKKYLRDGGDWLAIHAPAHSKIYSNDYQVLYYSHHVGEDIFTIGKAFADIQKISHKKWRQYDYLALRLSKNELNEKNSLLHEINRQPIIVFQNERGDQVRIYQIQ